MKMLKWIVLAIYVPLPIFGAPVHEGPRELDVIADVDVAVCGGGFAAAGAAIAAKQAGASVFVVMPRQNPADDIVSCRRLWRNPDDEGLDDDVFATTVPVTDRPQFSYVPSVEPDSKHPDANRTLLSDGNWGSVEKETVQYNSDVEWAIAPEDGAYGITSITVHYHVKSNYGSNGFSVYKDGVELPGTSETTSNSAYYTWRWESVEPVPVGEFVLKASLKQGCTRQLIGEIIIGSNGRFGTDAATPLSYSRAIDGVLQTAQVPYLTGAQVVDVLKNTNGEVRGIVIADRSGRQAIIAKTIVDATEWGAAVRKFAELRSAETNETVFTRTITISSESAIEASEGYTMEEKPCAVKTATISPHDLHPARRTFTYGLKTVAFSKAFEFTRTDYLLVNAINQEMRDALWDRTVVDESEKPFFVPPERICSVGGPVTSWTGARSLGLESLRPVGHGNVWVVGMMADVGRDIAERLSYPGVGWIVGRRVGAEAASVAARMGSGGNLSCGRESACGDGVGVVGGERVVEASGGTFAAVKARPSVRYLGGELEELGDVDVLVVGGGTAGGPAAIGASGEGKSVFVAEWLFTMGGVGTEGRIGRYYNGDIRGFTKEIDKYSKGESALGDCFYASKAEFFRRRARSGGANVVFGALAEGAVVSEGGASGVRRVRGAVIVLPDGRRGVVRAKAVVDATGNADVAAAAGAETVFLEAGEFAMQGSAASGQVLGESYRNSDVGFLNTPDALDISNFAKRARKGLGEKAWNLSNVIAGSRERRRIVGDWVVTELDEMCSRRYGDTIMHGMSNYDMHGFTTSSLMMFFETTHTEKFTSDLPYRALLPRNLEGVLVTGLAVSATRDAMPIIRMQPDVQNQGYAAGLAAAMGSDAGSLRGVDIKALQRRLVADGCLDERVLTDTDGLPSGLGLEEAATGLAADFRTLPVLLAFPDESKGLLASAYEAEASGSNKVAKACALMLLGDDRGFDDVTNALADCAYMSGKNFRGLGNFGRQTTFDDCLVFSLAHSQDARAEGVLAAYANKLSDEASGEPVALSHWRMLTLAAERLRSARIAANIALAAERRKALVEGFAKTGEVDAVSYSGENANDGERTKVLRELAELRARSRFGDSAAKARLGAYLDDYRRIYSNWARLALDRADIGRIVGVWKDANTVELNLGSPAEPVSWAGTLEVSDATLRFIATSDAVESGDWSFALLEGGDFEPVAPLAGSGAAELDKRAKRDAEWLAANVPAWRFDSANNGSGITVDRGYFASDSRIGEGNHAAFLFNSSGNGVISHGLTLEAEAECAVMFDIMSACYNGTEYNAAISVSVDGNCVTNLAAAKISSWSSSQIDLGVLAAGKHTLSLTLGAGSNIRALVDNVRLGKRVQNHESAEFPPDLLKQLKLKLGEATNVVLDGDFRLEIGSLHRDGRRIYGELRSTSPGGGEGVLFARPVSFMITIK